jgi:hypothetical protein
MKAFLLLLILNVMMMIAKMDILIGIVQQIETLMGTLVENGPVSTGKEVACEVCHPKELMEVKEPQEVLRRQQVMDILKISERTYYRHIDNGVLVPRQLGNRNYFYYSDLMEALEYSRVRGYL